jgi:drug/metabolite transporter (DMT)-like permease
MRLGFIYMKLSKHRLAVLALILTAIVWGASPPIFKWALDAIPPFTFIFVRFLLATLMLLPFTTHKLKVAKKDIPKIALLGFVGFTLHIPTIFIGLTLAPSINASMIATSAPVFLIIGSFFLLREKIHRKIIFGTTLSMIGILLIILRPFFESGFNGSIIGNLLFVISTLWFVIYTILLKEFRLPYSPLTITFWIFAFATMTFFPLYLWESHGVALNIPLQGLIGILFGAVFTSNVAYMLFNFALKYIHANEVGVFLYIDPVVTVLIAIPLLGETITMTFLLGALLVFSGIFIAEGRLHYHPLHKLKS